MTRRFSWLYGQNLKNTELWDERFCFHNCVEGEDWPGSAFHHRKLLEHGEMKRIACMVLLMLTVSISHANDISCTRENAVSLLNELYEEIAESIDAERDFEQERHKNGHVLAVRAAPRKKRLSDPEEYKVLIEEVKRIAAMLKTRPAGVCAEIAKLRRKYVL